MPSFLKSIRIASDLAVMSLAYWLAFLFRFEFQIPWSALDVLLVNWPWVALTHYLGLVVFGVPRMSWRYVNIRDTAHVVMAVAASTSVLVALRLTRVLPVASGGVIPLGVLAMDFVLVFVGLVGVRASRRL